MARGELKGMSEDVLDYLVAAAQEADGFRFSVHYHGDEYDVLYKRDDIDEVYTAEEFDETVKNLVLTGLDESRDQTEFNRWGHMDVAVRWFHHIIVVHIPLGDWEGVFFTFDRDEVPAYGALVDNLLTAVENSLPEGTSEESPAEHFS